MEEDTNCGAHKKITFTKALSGGLVIRFGYQNVNANLFTSAVDVYQVTFSVFGVYYITFYT